MMSKISPACFPFLIVSIIAINQAMGQCISGDCANGIGEMQLAAGIYKGEFLNNEPHGTGFFTRKVNGSGNRVDSVKDEGIFRHGIFLKGKRSILKSWEEIETLSDWYAQKAVYKVGSKFRLDIYPSKEEAGKTTTYPEDRVYTITRTAANGKKKEWKEYGFRFDEGDYQGGIKNGLPEGNGSFKNSHLEFNGVFHEGVPTALSSETNSYVDDRHKQVTNMQVENGMITQMTIMNNDTGRVFKLLQPKQVFDFLFNGDCDGYYEVTNKFGDVYTGMVNGWQYEGNGHITYKGGMYTGYFVQSKFHGMGVRETANTIDSGLFIRQELKRGFVTLRSDHKKYAYPVCLSGNCENGLGKISYLVKANDSVYRTYEGNLIEGLPNGYGVFKERRGRTMITITGNYVLGMLNGMATYEGNIGIVTKMTGTFRDDTLKAGTIYYNDQTAYEFNKDIVPGNSNPNKYNIFTSTVNAKPISGYSKYFTPAGGIVEGDFYVDRGLLFDVIYTDKSGNRIRMGFKADGNSISYDEADQWAQKYVAQYKANEELKRQQAAAYATAIKRQQQYAAAAENPANFTDKYMTVTCSACNGKGYIMSGYAVGSISYVSQEYMDNSGNWRRDLKGFVPAHNVTSRTPCEACHKRGTVTIKSREYIGPKY